MKLHSAVVSWLRYSVNLNMSCTKGSVATLPELADKASPSFNRRRLEGCWGLPTCCCISSKNCGGILLYLVLNRRTQSQTFSEAALFANNRMPPFGVRCPKGELTMGTLMVIYCNRSANLFNPGNPSGIWHVFAATNMFIPFLFVGKCL